MLLAAAGLASAQAPPLDWRHVGNSAIDLGLPSLGTGPFSRVWYSADGARLFAVTASERVFSTSDLERWEASQEAVPPAERSAPSRSLPEPRATVREAGGDRFYAFGNSAWRSDDGGATWANLTDWNGESLFHSAVADLAVSPADNDTIVIATATGIWRSADGGLAWSGVNESLPGLAGRRFAGVPSGVHGFAISAAGTASDLEWFPGERNAWRPVSSSFQKNEQEKAQRWSAILRTTVTAVAEAGDYVYTGSADGRVLASSDRGQTWRSFGGPEESGPVEAIYADGRDPRLALAVSGARAAAQPGVKSVHVRRTINGGIFWDDLTANLPDTAVHGVTADRASGAVYVASDAGVYLTYADLSGAAPATPWTALSRGLPASPARDVRLDANGNQLYVLLDGHGVYATIAPHRFRDARLVSAADYDTHPAAPGAVLTVLGARIARASTGEAPVPVLAATTTESQIQIPFDVKGDTLPLVLVGDRLLAHSLPLQSVSPAIFTDRDGAPMLIDADSGLLLDASRPARSNTRVQIIATGLGRVTPDWPTGVAAPLTDPPRVNATVHAWLDREPVDVATATLAPGYAGMYVVEIRIPSAVNAGPAELYIDAGGHESNRVRVWVEP
jgi:uncharacterized protein (TIGR03437 family)